MKIEAKEYNQGYTAGRRSAMYNLGTKETPKAITRYNYLDLLCEMVGVAYEDTELGETETDIRYFVIRRSKGRDGRKIDVVARVEFPEMRGIE